MRTHGNGLNQTVVGQHDRDGAFAVEMKRRRFLAVMGGALAAPGLAALQRAPESVLIIGAGIAGLAAARVLTGRGARVQLLEARSRTGGRIHTSRLWPDAPADLGASWIHGTRGNPLSELARNAGAETLVTRYDSAALYITPELAGIGVRGRGTAWASNLVERALAAAEDAVADMSIRDAVERISPTRERSPVRTAQLEHYLAGAFEQEYGGSTRELSAWWTGTDEEFGGNDVVFPRGYSQIIDHLSRGLDIRLDARVVHVRWGGRDVEVELATGERLRADRVIVTVPLGVLKQNAIRFTPALPDDKQTAIERLGMGLLNKQFLRFQSPFWPVETDWHECLKRDPGRWSQWLSLERAGSPVLIGFSAGDDARQVESLDDRAIVSEAMATLRTMFGSATPEPIATQVTRWSRDPFAFGSYSFSAVGSRPADRTTLARPEADGRLCFAGEACSWEYPGTVHGAYLSGLAAADT